MHGKFLRSKIYQTLSLIVSRPVLKRRFRDFLNSPYFNKKTELIRLLKLIESTGRENLSKENLILGMSSDTVQYTRRSLDHLLSDLNSLAEEFLGLEYQKKEFLAKETICLKALNHHHLEKAFEYRLLKYRETLERTHRRNAHYFQARSSLIFEELTYHSKRGMRKPESFLSQLAESLDQLHSIQKLRYACAVLNNGKFFQNTRNIELHPDQLERCENLAQDNPVLACYLGVYHWLTKGLEESIDEVFEVLINNPEALHPIERYDFFLLLLNIHLFRHHGGVDGQVIRLKRIMTYLYQSGIAYALDGYLSPFLLKNTISVGILTSDIDWTQKRLEEGLAKVRPKLREDAKNFNEANLAFFKNDYYHSLNLLQNVNPSDPCYKLSIRVLQLKIYYEQGEEGIEPLLSLVHSFRVWLRGRKELAPNVRERYKAFMSIVKKLALCDGIEDHSRVKSEIDSAVELAERDWIGEKMIELEIRFV